MDQRSILLPDRLAGGQRFVGVANESVPLVAENWIRSIGNRFVVIIVENDRQAERLAADIRYYNEKAIGGSLNCVRYPELDTNGDDANAAFESGTDRFAALGAIHGIPEGERIVWIATIKALSQRTPEPLELASRQIELRSRRNYGFAQLVEDLESLDYDSESLCEAPGQFARRGGLIDIYPVTEDRPYRIDFFGDEIESISELDPVTQRSGNEIQTLSIVASPRLEMAYTEEGILPHLPDTVCWCIVEPDTILDSIRDADRDDDSHSIGSFWQMLKKRRTPSDSWSSISDLDLDYDNGSEDDTHTFEAESLSFYRSLPDPAKLAHERLEDEQAARIRFLEQAQQWQENGERLVFMLPSESDTNRVRQMLEEAPSLKGLKPTYWEGDLNAGFRIRFRKNLARLDWPMLSRASGIVIVTETEIFGRRRNRRPPNRSKALVNQSQVDQLLDFAELVEGEFVVHLQHGIAHYRGIAKVEIRGQQREVLSLEFDEGMILHVPLQESHLISRYLGLTKTRPKLGRLGSNRWAKTREAAERATIDLAAQLLEIQAKRDTATGHPFASDAEWQLEFEAGFPFKETPDQMKAIVETKKDMEKTIPMDRLICGDVGFGKTEVAIRGAFKAVMDGKQVAILVPTTVLAQQHYLNFRDRMAGYPIVVEHVSRFRKPKEIKQILKATTLGKVDILIGTHRLIQKDVKFARLGLVVIDEEQRFGVKHKEVFKQWRQTVDMLSMSATPIPRTLYMALTGARELSVIETPPQERKPIKTIVKSYDDKLVKEVIKRELDRGGQVFYLHNRVQTIDTVAGKLQQLIPEARIGIGHGQMNEKDLEQVMIDFVDERYQVLVCTTIIESGLDIPNCNTIIIEGADRFGLGQLYQIRGRVGRFKRQAYAYLLLHKHKRLMDIARKRLQAIRQHNQLGAGFRIAMRDLELRGAGNLLGSEQSGHIVGVGFELYCQLLKQSIARLKGETTAQLIRATVKLDFVYQGEGQQEGGSKYEDNYTILKRLETKEGECEPIPARIPATYLAETRLRIDLYRKLAMAETPRQIRQIQEDILDRFGTYPSEVEALLKLSEIRCLAEEKGILCVESQGNRLKCRLNSSKRDDFIMLGTRFPRLKSNNALKRLGEVIVFLRNQKSITH